MTVRTNYCIAPSFEVDTNSDGLSDNWSKDGSPSGSVLWTRPTGLFGSSAQRVQYTGVAGDNAMTFGLLHDVTAVGSFAPGDVVTTSFYMKGTFSTAQLSCYPTIFWRNASGGAVATAQGSDIRASVTTGWQQFSYTFAAAPASTSRLYFEITFNNFNAGYVIDLTVDGVLIEKAAAVGSYFDGSGGSAGYTFAWAGAANASNSTATTLAAQPHLMQPGGVW